jgi:phasin
LCLRDWGRRGGVGLGRFRPTRLKQAWRVLAHLAELALDHPRTAEIKLGERRKILMSAVPQSHYVMRRFIGGHFKMDNKGGIHHFEVPPDLRAATEKSIEQARAAFNKFISAAQQAMSEFEGHAKAMQAGAKDVSEKAMSYAERNVANTFAFADRLVHAKDIQQVIVLQTEFVQAQMKELAAQSKELGEATLKYKPPKP